jgi:hypothetical protein
LDAEGLPVSDLLSAEQIQRAFEEADALFGQEEDDRYTPALTLWGFLSQALHAGTERSCNAAVERIRSLCVTLEIDAPSSDSGAYCRARAKLPETVLQRLTYEVADALETQVPKAWLWFGRHVKIADGSTLLAPDTEKNQAAWPQAPTQQPGLGFPILRFCALFSWATGALCGFAEGQYRTTPPHESEASSAARGDCHPAAWSALRGQPALPAAPPLHPRRPCLGSNSPEFGS